MQSSRFFGLLLVTLVSIVNSKPLIAEGPFGFEAGMTKQRIETLIGKIKPHDEVEDVYETNKAPRGHKDFEDFSLFISPSRGLVKITALSADIETSVYGNELRSKFSEIEQEITNIYGQGRKFDFLRSGSIWDEPKYFMTGLLTKERSLQTFWSAGDGQELKNNITGIRLEAVALRQNVGYLFLGYEFVGYEEYSEGKKEQEEQVF